MFAEFISEYGTTILYTIITAIAGWLGIVVKNLYAKYIDDKTKKDVVHTVVQGVEQLYKDLKGDEKLSMALEAASGMLAEKNINISELELRMLIEAAVGEFNEVFWLSKSSASGDNAESKIGFAASEEVSSE